jgi:spoIIIJ-associated protein
MLYRVEVSSFDEAYQKALKKFNCDLSELNIEIIQTPNNGFLGFFKKKLIIDFSCYNLDIDNSYKGSLFFKKLNTQTLVVKELSTDKANLKIGLEKNKNITIVKKIEYDEIIKKELELFQTFHTLEVKKIYTLSDEIGDKIDSLFCDSCLDLKVKKVEINCNDGVYIELDGSDSSLFNIKNSQSYDSLSYMLFSWIYEQYSLSIKLEVGTFIQDLKRDIEIELSSIIKKATDNIDTYKILKTKPMEGISLHLALTILRETLPNRYIYPHRNDKNQKIIIIEDNRR